MQRLKVSGVVRPLKWSVDVTWLRSYVTINCMGCFLFPQLFVICLSLVVLFMFNVCMDESHK